MSKIWLLFLVPTILFGSNPDIDACLNAWGKHPFKQPNYKFRKLNANVKVLGIGGSISDTESTPRPDLVLIQHSVAVLSKQTLELMNPNGWYCIKGAVTVLGKAHIKAHCKAHIQTTGDGANILGSDTQGNGVTVLGKIQLERVGCADENESKEN